MCWTNSVGPLGYSDRDELPYMSGLLLVFSLILKKYLTKDACIFGIFYDKLILHLLYVALKAGQIYCFSAEGQIKKIYDLTL